MPFTFRPDTNDTYITAAIWQGSEYWLPERFAPTDVIVDVGCHIGAFVAACLDRRPALVIGCEADATNAAVATAHFAGDPRASIRHVAVWRSDVLHERPLHHSGYSQDQGMVNTGGGDVFALDGPPVGTVSLDELLTTYGPVRLLKLDCEGSEFVILLTSQALRLAQTIVGEVHEYGGDHDDRTPPFALPGGLAWTGFALGQYLISRGYTVQLQRKHDSAGRPTRLLSLHAERCD